MWVVLLDLIKFEFQKALNLKKRCSWRPPTHAEKSPEVIFPTLMQTYKALQSDVRKHLHIPRA
jgi:hypothetical protein